MHACLRCIAWAAKWKAGTAAEQCGDYNSTDKLRLIMHRKQSAEHS